MLHLRLMLLLVVGLSLGATYSFADSVARPSSDARAAATDHKKKAAVRGARCRYVCPKGLYVCTDVPPDDNGCYPYTCTKGRPGSDSCP